LHTYLRATAELVAAGGAPVYLEVNHRSSEPLIRGYNAILDESASLTPSFFRGEGSIHYDHPVSCGRPRLALRDAAGQEAPAVVVLDIENAAKTWQLKRALLARIASEIAGLLSDETGLRFGEGEDASKIRARDIFVLTRTTRESREVGDALRSAGLPFAYFKQEKLFQTVEAREVLDLLRAVADPDDTTLRARAWSSAFFALSLPDLAACDDLPPGHPLVALLYRWKALAEAGDFEALFAAIVRESGIVSRQVFLRSSERALTNYLHLLELLQEEASRSRGTLRELVATLGAYMSGTRKPPRIHHDMQRLETDGDAVQIMTIHQAKGLEATVVFIYGGLWTGPQNEVKVFHDEKGSRAVRVGRQPRAEQRLYDDERDDEERRVYYVALTRARGRMYLPRFPRAFKYLRGAYRFINDRLHAVLEGAAGPDARRLFHCVPIAQEDAMPADATTPALPAFVDWTPPPALVAASSDDRSFATIVENRAGFVMSSYSAVKRLRGGFVPAGLEADDPTAGDSLADGHGPGALGSSLPADIGLPPAELPRGRLSGTFLHGLLEEVPLDSFDGGPSFAAWWARPGIRDLFERIRRRHDRNPAYLPHAASLVHTALGARVRLGETSIAGLASAGPNRVRREMEFLYPIPEARHPLLHRERSELGLGLGLDVGEAAPWRVERGLVKGFIDFLFQHGARTYVCDWKGDWLPSWQPAAVAHHSQRNYGLQGRLYTLAALRFLGITDPGAYDAGFGGILYCFLRGMSGTDPTAGVHFYRPPWNEVLEWERAMLTSAFWGLA
jgi:exodeoxyribonuclease V beta subunit